MRAALLAVFSLLVYGGAAHAATRLCIPSQQPRVVPVDPSFIVHGTELPHFAATTPEGEQLAFTSSALDEFWYRVTVSAPDGTEFKTFGNRMLTSCGERRSRLRASAAWSRNDGPPRILEARRGSRERRAPRILLMVTLADTDSVLRAEWAYSREELDGGLHAATVSRGRGRSIALGIDGGQRVVLRLTPLLADGSEGRVWEGILYRNRPGDWYRMRTGLDASDLPPRSVESRECAADTPWMVGQRPVLLHRDGEARFRATTDDGQILPVTVTPFEGRLTDLGARGTCVGVSVEDNVDFVLERLPLGSECPVSFRAAQGNALPGLSVVQAEVLDEARIRFHVTGPQEVLDGEAHLEWAAQRPRISVADGVAEFSASQLRWDSLFLESEASDWRFELTPVRKGFVGRTYHGQLQGELADFAVTLSPEAGRLSEVEHCPAAAPAPSRAPAGPERPPTSGSDADLGARSATGRGASLGAAALAGTALLAWLLAASALRRARDQPIYRTLDGWSIPQAAFVSAVVVTGATLSPAAAAAAGAALALSRAVARSRGEPTGAKR